MNFLTRWLSALLSMVGFGPMEFQCVEIFGKQFDIYGACEFELINVNGSIDIIARDVTAITIQAEKKYAKMSDKDNFKVVCNVDVVQDGITRVSCQSQGSSRNPYEINYTITVPLYCTKVVVYSVNGPIKLMDVQGVQYITNVNGQISIINPGNLLLVKNVNGSVSIDNPGAVFDVDNVNGSIQVDIKKDIVGDCQLITVSGAINVKGVKFIQGRLTPTTVWGSVKLL